MHQCLYGGNDNNNLGKKKGRGQGRRGVAAEGETERMIKRGNGSG